MRRTGTDSNTARVRLIASVKGIRQKARMRRLKEDLTCHQLEDE